MRNASGELLDVSTINEKSADTGRFLTWIRRIVDKGVPLLWGMVLTDPEESFSRSSQQGGHIRLISGYNLETGEIIFSDSWGAGRSHKTMPLGEAFSKTTCLFVIYPSLK